MADVTVGLLLGVLFLVLAVLAWVCERVRPR